MAANPKALAKIASVLGGCVAFPWLLVKTNNFGNTTGGEVTKTPVKKEEQSPPKNVVKAPSSEVETQSPKVNLPSRKLPRVENPRAERGKCEVEDLSVDSINLLVNQGQGDKFYVEIFCQDTNVSTAHGSLPHHWTGLFPIDLIANSETLAVGKKFDIHTNTVSSAGIAKTSFSGKGMKSPVEGEWGARTKAGESSTAIPVSIKVSVTGNTETIYLILD